MRILIGVAILATLALLASSRLFWSLRRTRAGAAWVTGGWLLVGVGMLIGPYGVGLVEAADVRVVRPLILCLLGWVGLVVGLQADRRLLRRVPRAVMRLAMWDALASLVIVTSAVAAVVAWYTGGLSMSVFPVAMLLGVCAMSWSAEVRSLRIGRSGLQPITRVVRAASGLGSLLAVVVYGLSFKSYALGEMGEVVLLPQSHILLGLGASVLIGGTMGLVGLWLINMAEHSEGEFLVVLIGLVTFTAGSSAALGYAPLFVSFLTGATLANLPGRWMQRLRRVLMEAEQSVAMAAMLAAGVMADPWIGAAGMVLAVVLIAGRAVVKLGLGAWRLRAISAAPTAVTDGLVRQSPLAIILAMGYIISPVGNDGATLLSGPQLLTVVIICGLLCECWPFLRRPVTPEATSRPVQRISPWRRTGTVRRALDEGTRP